LRITFLVGDAADVFPPDFASSAQAELRKRFPSLTTGEEAYRSDDVDVLGWRELQRRVGAAVPQVSRMEAYQAVYLPSAPATIEPVAIANAGDPLQIGSVDALLAELRAFAASASLPTDDIELMQLGTKYLEDDALYDSDLDVQTYIQLMLSAKQAAARGLPLWIVC
jgi:hypothetical protein